MMIVTPSKDNQTDGEVWYGMTRWYIDDVKYLAPEWTDEQCHEFMERHDRHFKDRMIELGWEVLDLYVAQEKRGGSNTHRGTSNKSKIRVTIS
jgi:hypothetical protein